MTLTALLPTLRRSLPDPLDPRHWPEHTTSTVDDVVIGGVSLVRLCDLEGTPCVLTGDLSHVRAREARARGIGTDVTVVVCRITRVESTDAGAIAIVDGALDTVAAHGPECRLIGRVSTAKPVAFGLHGGAGSHGQISVSLPADLRPGDLIALPCRGAVALHDVRVR